MLWFAVNKNNDIEMCVHIAANCEMDIAKAYLVLNS